MGKRDHSQHAVLNLKAGEWVEVRSRAEILATLDEHSRLENLPFMPEMLQYCGQKFQVFKRADKTCDYIQPWSIRRMTNSVHLAGVRCDGSGHDGCQAGCLIFWKESWLKRAENNFVPVGAVTQAAAVSPTAGGGCTEKDVLTATQTTNSADETVYSCQGTDVPKFTSYMKMWDPRQYVRDLRSGNLASGLARDTRTQRMLEMVLGILKVLGAIAISLFNEVQTRRHGMPYPFVEGSGAKSPIEVLDLQPGELVQVRTKEEIMATLDKNQRNRGLWFDSEMLPYCGGIYRVLRRVHRIVEEKTGRMINMKHPCIVLEGVVCRADFHRLCPRAIYPYWRENWLRRAMDVPLSRPVEQLAETCDKSYVSDGSSVSLGD